MLIGLPVTVIGAGVAGLATAAALARFGAQVRVLEQAPALNEVGAGLQISPNGAVVLEALGCGEALLGEGLENDAVVLRDYRAGRQVLRLDLRRGRRGKPPFVLLHRARLIAMLERAAREVGVEVVTGVRADPAEIKTGLIVGADGLKSATRAMLNGAEGAFFTGQVAWRAVVPGGGGPVETQVFMGPGRHLVSYPLAGGLRNIVAVEERPAWAEEDWAQTDDPDHLRLAFKGFAPEVRDWLSRVETVHLWGLFRHEVAGRWYGDGAVLAGDAAHPTLPFLAQGANLALEDAFVLAGCLSRAPLAEALVRYQKLRRGRVIRAIRAANANARNYHLRNPVIRRMAHSGLRLGAWLAPDAPLRRFAWLYEHDVTGG